MINLNEIAELSYNSAKKRQDNGANISVDTMKMLKHTATEVIEATEAYMCYDLQKDDAAFPEFVEQDKQNFASELADIIACVLIIAHNEKVDIEEALKECVEKNRKRAKGIGDKK